jgi:hypothetical protein
MGMDQPPSQPPMGGSKPPDFGEMGDKLKAAQGPDKTLLIAGFLFLIATFLPWWRVSAAGFGSASENAWGVGGLGALAALFGLATLVFAVTAVTGMLKPNPSFGLLALVLAGGTLLFTLLRFLFKPGGSASTAAEALSRGLFKITRGIGLWAGLVLAILMAIAAFQKYQASNG